MKLPTFDLGHKISKIKLSRKTLLILIFFLLLSSFGGWVGYKYVSANQALEKCDRAFSERRYMKAALDCERSARLWHRDEAVAKSEKAKRVYRSHRFYLEGLRAYSKRQWKDALENLSKVIEEDPNYPDAVEKIALAQKEIESRKVAGAQDKTQKKTSSNSVISTSPLVAKKAPPPAPNPSTTKK